MNVCDYSSCCGCGACVAVCPIHILKMIQNTDGFWVPQIINMDACINCKKCLACCPTHADSSKVKNNVKKCYAGYFDSEKVLKRSSSGGIFSALASSILNSGGIVYGCGYDENLVPVHMSITDINRLDRLRRSKYVQSNTNNTFELVKGQLEHGLKVLYCGTPCQIAGLKLYLGKNYSNLITIDIICHGVPSEKFFAEQISYWSNRLGDKIKNYEFRLKNGKKSNYNVFIKTEKGNGVFKPYYEDPYYEAFYNMKSYNEECYVCPYSCLERCGDITIGDYFWAADHHPELSNLDIEKGYEISCILVNTELGQNVIEEIKDNLYLVESRIEWIVERNKNLLRPTIKPEARNDFYNNIWSQGFARWVKLYYRSDDYLINKKIMKCFIKIKRKLRKKFRK